MSSCVARLKSVELELEKDQTKTQQSKVNSSWLKTANKKLIKAWGSWVTNTNRSFTIVDFVYSNWLLDFVKYGLNVQVTSSSELLNVYLLKVAKEINN